jgi:hypothetical protein
MSEGECIEKSTAIERVKISDMCIQDGCSADLCDILTDELESLPRARPRTRAQAVQQASLAVHVVLEPSDQVCAATTVRCSRSYADCSTRVANSYAWTPTLIRSSHVGMDSPYQIQDEGTTLLFPAMDGSAAARPRSPLPKGKVRISLSSTQVTAFEYAVPIL